MIGGVVVRLVLVGLVAAGWLFDWPTLVVAGVSLVAGVVFLVLAVGSRQ